MAIGVLEASQITLLEALGLDPTIGLSVSFLVRLKDMFRMVVGGSALSYFGFSLKKAMSNNKEKEQIKNIE